MIQRLTTQVVRLSWWCINQKQKIFSRKENITDTLKTCPKILWFQNHFSVWVRHRKVSVDDPILRVLRMDYRTISHMQEFIVITVEPLVRNDSTQQAGATQGFSLRTGNLRLPVRRLDCACIWQFGERGNVRDQFKWVNQTDKVSIVVDDICTKWQDYTV